MTDAPGREEREVDQAIEELAGRLGRLSLTPAPSPSTYLNIIFKTIKMITNLINVLCFCLQVRIY